MQVSHPTRGQLERSLSQRIQALYRDQLGHRPGKITCHIFDEKIVILLEDAVTAPEQLLASAGQDELAEQVRLDLDKAIQPQLQQVIEEVVKVPVTDLLSNAKLETGRTGTIAILASAPQVRESASKSKRKKETASS